MVIGSRSVSQRTIKRIIVTECIDIHLNAMNMFSSSLYTWNATEVNVFILSSFSRSGTTGQVWRHGV